MSNLLHDAVGIGDIITMSVPCGDVVLDDSGRPVVFASAGIGIAPMAGMLSHLATAGSGLSITLLYADAHEAASRCAARSSATSSRCATPPSISGTRRAHRAMNRSRGATPEGWT